MEHAHRETDEAAGARAEPLSPALQLVILAKWLNGETPPPAAAIAAMEAWRDGLRAWLASGCTASLDVTFGLRKRGGVSPAQEMALLERDELVVRLWLSMEGWRELDVLPAARLMATSLRRYRDDGAWQRDRRRIDPPATEPAATWWKILSSGMRVPGSSKQLARILSSADIRSPV